VKLLRILAEGRLALSACHKPRSSDPSVAVLRVPGMATLSASDPSLAVLRAPGMRKLSIYKARLHQ